MFLTSVYVKAIAVFSRCFLWLCWLRLQTRILSPHHHFLDTWLICKILKISIEKKTSVEDLFCWFAFLSSKDALAVEINIHVLITIWLTKQMFYQIVWYYQLLNDRSHDSEFGRLNNSSRGNKFWHKFVDSYFVIGPAKHPLIKSTSLSWTAIRNF